MCLSPIIKTSNKKYFLPGRWESYYSEFPCGQCAECRANRELDEYFRGQWMSREVFEKYNGYIIFDTLTYKECTLPHVKDICNDLGIKMPNGFLPNSLNFSCFRQQDFRLFLVRLRRYLSYHYGVESNCFNYFMASEYGEKTHRPHYHVIFYVLVPETVICPVDFSNAIDLCWSLGRTDGVPYQGRKYFEEKRLFRSSSCQADLLAATLNVVQYVSKYVHKDSDFQEVIDDRISGLFEYLHPGICYEDLWKMISGDYEAYRMWKKFVKNVSPFSRKGHHYGEYYIDWLNKDENSSEYDSVVSSGMVVMPQQKNGKKYKHSLPSYYARKLFSEQVRDSKGHLYWRPTSLGLQFKKMQIKSSIDNMTKKYRDFYKNRLNYGMSKEDLELLEDAVKNNPRSIFREVAEWYRLYEGRLIPEGSRFNAKNFTLDGVKMPVPDEMIDIIVENMYLSADANFRDKILSMVGKHVLFEGKRIMFNYSSITDVAHFGQAFICDKNLGSKDYGYDMTSYKNYECGWNMERDTYIPFLDKKSPEYDGHTTSFFGAMFTMKASGIECKKKCWVFRSLYNKYMTIVAEKKQEAYEIKERVRKLNKKPKTW